MGFKCVYLLNTLFFWSLCFSFFYRVSFFLAYAVVSVGPHDGFDEPMPFVCFIGYLLLAVNVTSARLNNELDGPTL